MLLNFCIFFMASCFVSTVTSLREDLNIPYKSHCYSCATFAYLQIWDNLMHHYFPPKNFTDRCWQPDNAIGTVPCSSACFTIVERIDQHDYIEHNEYSGVMRGCVDRLLLFGLDDDVTNILTPSIDREDFCRQTDRKLLRLYPLSDESELEMTAILVFVYGTLKKGEPNHHVMVETEGEQRLVGRGVTQQEFTLVVASKYNIPFLLNNPGSGKHIEGEVYEIDEKKLQILDELEAYPQLYDRRLEKICLIDEGEVEAWVYVMRKWRTDILQISTPLLSNYSSNGDHGRPYVEEYKRAKQVQNGEAYDLYTEIQGAPIYIAHHLSFRENVQSEEELWQ